MIPSAFAYERAESVDHAIRLLQAAGSDAKLIAGGHSLLPVMKLRLATPQTIVDLGRIEELKKIVEGVDEVVVGALATYARVTRDPLVLEKIPLLAEVARTVGDIQVRNRGTIGGSIAHADPAADVPAVAIALDATIHAATPEGPASFTMDEFVIGPLTTSLPENSLVTSIAFSVPPDGARTAYEKFSHPASGYAVVGVAAVLRVTEGAIDYARVAITGAGDLAYRAHAVERALLGRPANDESLRAAAACAAQDGEMAEDLFASSPYRAHLCQVYTLRALRRCL